MRKLIVANIMSLDGYFDGPGGDVMVMPVDECFDTYNAERVAAADTLLLRRRSYDLFKGASDGRLGSTGTPRPDHHPARAGSGGEDGVTPPEEATHERAAHQP